MEGQGGRPTKYSDEIADRICKYLADGNSRKTAAAASGIHYDTLRTWELEKSEFSERLIRAEAEAEAHMALVLRKAADGVPYERHTVTTSTEIRIRKTKQPDGTVIEEPVPVEVKSESTQSGVEYDWRAAESWLKRRRHRDWGDRQRVDVSDLTDDQIIALLEGTPDEGGGETETVGSPVEGGA